MTSFLTLIFMVFPFSIAHAELNPSGGWNEASLKTEQDFAVNSPLFANPFAATVWGCVKSDTDGLSDEEKLYLTVYLQTDYYGKKLPAYLKTQKQGDSPFTRNAPLMVIVPGVFSSAFDGNILAKADHFYQAGYHVLVLSNPFSEDSIQHRPNYMPGNIEAEGKWLSASIQTAVSREISWKYVSSIGVYGESYGAFITAVAAGQDDPNDPLFTGKILLASPPLQLVTALQQLDKMYDETVSDQGFCKANELSIGMNFMHAHAQGDLNGNSLYCAEAVVAAAFNKGLWRSMLALQKTNLEVPSMQFDNHFQFYLDHFVPALGASCKSTEKCNLHYWLALAMSEGRNNVSIVAAQDDFLNAGASWDEIKTILPNPETQLMLLNWGGHLGYNGSSTFTHVLYTN